MTVFFNINKALLVIIVSFIFTPLISQNVSILGVTDTIFNQKTIYLNSFTDFVSLTKLTESVDTINDQGHFTLKAQINEITPVTLNIDNVFGNFYLEPNTSYTVYFSKPDSTINPDLKSDIAIQLISISSNTNDINFQISLFNKQHNLFFENQEEYLTPKKITQKIDSFTTFCRNIYSNHPSDFLKNYIKYTIANLYSSSTANKKMLAKYFINNSPILYNNKDYMRFIKSYYFGYLMSKSTAAWGQHINDLHKINQYQTLKSALKNDSTLKNDTLKELIILTNMMELYYNPSFHKPHIQSIVEQIYHSTSYYKNKQIAHHFINYINLLQPNSVAPNAVMLDYKNNQVQLNSFIGKYIYLNFFSTTSPTSLKEMMNLKTLFNKYHKQLTIISVCLDNTFEVYQQFVKNNSDIKWPVFYQTPQARSAYNIISASAYFLIDKNFYLLYSPAIAPSEGIDKKLNAILFPKKNN